MPISFAQAALGASVKVPTLDGFENLQIPGGAQHGDVFKLKGKGLPDLRSHHHGDELVQILIEVPRKLTDAQRKLLEDYALTEDAATLPQKKSFLDKLKGLFE